MDRKLETFIASVSTKDLKTLEEMIESDEIQPVVDRTYPLSPAPEAIVYLDEGRARGKVVITV